MNYSEYGVDDFLNDESFQSFALKQKSKDKVFWLEWIAKNPTKKNEVDEAIKILTSFSLKDTTHSESIIEADLQKLQNAFDQQKKSRVVPIGPSKFNWRIAASIALLIGIGIAAWQYVTYFHSKAEKVIVQKDVPNGKKLTFMLPDGSLVKLNGNSSLKYEQNYLLKQRKVTLTGEAYFEVAKDAINPFIVISGDLSTVALGTSFNIKAYADDPQIEISLLTGKVSVTSIRQSSPEEYFLDPGDGIRYTNENSEIITYEFNTEEVMAWKNGIIKFKNASIKEVANKLERWYGVNIQVNNPPDQAWKLNGSFENESLENVLKSISFSTPLKYTLNDNQLEINFLK
ncbi:MAG: DUF4974 domain-containing protein [Cyclobacteriaceae bacterium]